MQHVVKIRQPEHFRQEPWCALFRAPIDGREQMVVIANLARADAEQFFSDWQQQPGLRMCVCHLCPTGAVSECTHDETPAQRGWLARELTEVRIMPEREVLR